MGDIQVTKKQIGGHWDAYLHNDEIRITDDAKDLEAAEMKKQLTIFRRTYNANGSAQYAAAGSGRDDYVLALTYAIYRLSNRRSGGGYTVTHLAELIS